jgi:hypothetical protein
MTLINTGEDVILSYASDSIHADISDVPDCRLVEERLSETAKLMVIRERVWVTMICRRHHLFSALDIGM